MIIDINGYGDIDTDKRYDISTKYPYVLPPILPQMKISAVIYDWHVASKLTDVLSEYSRIKQMDPTLPPINKLNFIVLKDVEFNEVILADYYIEDITIDMNSGS